MREQPEPEYEMEDIGCLGGLADLCEGCFGVLVFLPFILLIRVLINSNK